MHRDGSTTSITPRGVLAVSSGDSHPRPLLHRARTVSPDRDGKLGDVIDGGVIMDTPTSREQRCDHTHVVCLVSVSSTRQLGGVRARCLSTMRSDYGIIELPELSLTAPPKGEPKHLFVSGRIAAPSIELEGGEARSRDRSTRVFISRPRVALLAGIVSTDPHRSHGALWSDSWRNKRGEKMNTNLPSTVTVRKSITSDRVGLGINKIHNNTQPV